MFIATPLYITYALVQGAALVMADLLTFRVHHSVQWILWHVLQMAINLGLALDIFNFVMYG